MIEQDINLKKKASLRKTVLQYQKGLRDDVLVEKPLSLYKCHSKDSLPSLQHLIERSPEGVLNNKRKYIVNDRSSYSKRPNPGHNVMKPTTAQTNFLRPRLEFSGYQLSGYKRYQVNVSLKTVNLPTAQSNNTTTSPHITGYLTIRGLTSQHPEITTFFEAYAVDHKEIGFLSSQWPEENNFESYKTDDQTDLEHWLNFPSFREMFIAQNKEDVRNEEEYSYKKKRQSIGTLAEMFMENQKQSTDRDYLNDRFIFMRWKEKFLVPDAFIENVDGASYDGFYYVVHDQLTGNLQGFYYHQDAERFQQLELVPCKESQELCNSSCTFEFA
ncbi:Vacuolar import and degradation protein 24 [Nakaseomyces bracarensis]|uniref:Vacuolar import and degradation protein 24 n=1 Tax=Nakaseomyces bracarensis TaxID=273131 RepID=A0ABR4NY16_9SACH